MELRQQMAVIRRYCRSRRLRWTQHIMIRLIQRGISMDDVSHALLHGDIIEDYPDDYPSPSCLVLGDTVSGHPLHVVCGIGDDELYLVTAYIPDEDSWSSDFRERRDD